MALLHVLVGLLLLCCGYSCASEIIEEESGSGEVITVPNASNCSNTTDRSNATDQYCIDTALNDISNSNSSSRILLEPGVHYLKKSHHFFDLEYLELVGETSSARPVICCEGADAGIAFLNVTNVTVENVEFSGCGFSGHNAIQKYIDEHLVSTYYTPEKARVVIFAVLCHDFLLRNVSISDTPGIGFLSYNNKGSLQLDSVRFFNNTPTSECFQNIAKFEDASLFNNTLGGGAVVIYEERNASEDTITPQLIVQDCNFTQNTDCGLGGYSELFQSQLPLFKGKFVSSAAGGLSILQTQPDFYINATVTNTTFIGNKARFGSGMHIAIFEGVTNSTISISDCDFVSNGLMFAERLKNQSSVQGGGGVALFTDTPKLNTVIKLSQELKNNITFNNCKFNSNFGLVGGGLRLFNKHLTPTRVYLVFENCSFYNNTGIIGAAMVLLENLGTSSDSHFDLQVIDSNITNNQILLYSDFDVNAPTSLAGIMSFGAARVSMSGKVMFSNNNGTSFSAIQTLLKISSGAEVSFCNNTGEYGGAMRLVSYSQIVIMDNSTLSFIGNSASAKGGAVYVDLTAQTIVASTGYQDCFLYFREVNIFCSKEYPCTDISETGVRVEFMNNAAPLAATVFGSTLDCAWAAPLKQNYSENNVYDILDQYYSNVFNFSDSPVGIDQVATETDTLMLVQPLELDAQVLAPGEVVSMEVIALDRFGQHIPTVISSRSDNATIYSFLNDTNFSSLENANDTTVYLHLAAHNNRTVRNTSRVTVAITSLRSPAQFPLDLFLRPCYLGFQYNSSTRSCECSQALQDHNISCDPANSVWVVPSDNWLGPLDPKLTNSSTLVLMNCNEDFCRPGIKYIRPKVSSYSLQCTEGYNRVGLGCGGCAKNYSLVFGSNRCVQCSDAYLAVIPAFALAGVLLMLALLCLPLRISEGYLNGALLYSNIITLFSSSLFTSQGFVSYITFFIASILSLDLGFELCFYDGMNATTRIGLQFVFPIYLFFLIGLVVLIGRFFRLPAWLGTSLPNTFATLIILCYSRISAVCFDILSPTFISVIPNDNHTNEYVSIRWSLNPSIEYFQGSHAVLCIIALIVVVIYLIPFPFLFFSPYLAFKVKFLRRLKPIYDAVWNPFRPNYRWWIGFRLMFRCLPFLLARLVSIPELNLLLVGIALLLLLYLQLVLKPFNGSWNLKECELTDWLRNEIDSFFLMNLIVILLGALYFHGKGDFLNLEIFVGVLVLLAYIAMAGIVIHALVNVCRKVLKKKIRLSVHVPTTTVTINGEALHNESEEGHLLLVKHRPSTAPTFTELREPLLDDENQPTPSISTYEPIP